MEIITGHSVLDKYFDENTMSVHFKARCHFMKKVGKPGAWKSIRSDKVIEKKEIEDIITAIFKELETREDGFLEIDKPLSKVVQLGPYRIVIVYPPLSDGLEITAVKPVKKLTLSEYNLDPKLVDLLSNQAKGILISGSPGSGKTTFGQAVVEHLLSMQKIIKTIESPRDLLVSDDITQYSFSYGTHNEIRDILLLSRPDYAMYDEVRNTEDFELYKDLRLTGIGLIGVIHATKPIDGIQRFLGTIELGIIPQIIDTIIFIEAGQVQEVLHLKLTVKLPEGMESADLARPVIQVKNYFSDELRYEIYSFGEQIVVIPMDELPKNKSDQPNGMRKFAENYLHQYFEDMFDHDFLLKVESDKSIKLYIPEQFKGKLIGKSGENIQKLEKQLGVSISVRTYDDLPLTPLDTSKIDMKGRNQVIVTLGEDKKFSTIGLKIGSKISFFKTDAHGSILITATQLVKQIANTQSYIVDESF